MAKDEKTPPEETPASEQSTPDGKPPEQQNPPIPKVTWDRPLDPMLAQKLDKNHEGLDLVWVKSGRQDDRVVLWEPSLSHPGGEAWIAGEKPERVAMTAAVAMELRNREAVLVDQSEVDDYHERKSSHQFTSVRLEDLESQLQRLMQQVRAERDRLSMASPMVPQAGGVNAPAREIPTPERKAAP